MNKRTTRLIGASIAFCLFACAISFGVLATINGFALWSGSDTSVYADPDELDHKTNEEAVYADPGQQAFRYNTPSVFADPYILPWRMIGPE